MSHDDTSSTKSSGVAKAGLTTGIIGTALGVLNGGIGGILPAFGGGYRGFGGGCGYSPFGVGAAPIAHGLMKEGEMDRYIIENERRLGHMEARLAGLAVAEQKDQEIDFLRNQLGETRMLRYVDQSTCGVIKGTPYISPRQMADPYMGSRQVISTHPPVHIDIDGHCHNRKNDCWDTWY